MYATWFHWKTSNCPLWIFFLFIVLLTRSNNIFTSLYFLCVSSFRLIQDIDLWYPYIFGVTNIWTLCLYLYINLVFFFIKLNCVGTILNFKWYTYVNTFWVCFHIILKGINRINLLSWLFGSPKEQILLPIILYKFTILEGGWGGAFWILKTYYT